MARRLVLFASALAIAAFGPAVAQDPNLGPTYGAVTLGYGFQPDPHGIAIEAGGPIDAAAIGAGCVGFIADAPDYSVTYEGPGAQPLSFFVQAAVDTTLVVNDPNGNWFCDDDGLGDFNPVVHFENALPGRYDVWVGLYEAGAIQPATLGVTEVARDQIPGIAGNVQANAGAPTARLDMELAPNFGEATFRRFIDPTFTVNIEAGGDIDVGLIAELAALGCVGHVTAAPDFRVQYGPEVAIGLYFDVAAENDTTLIVNDPNGNWFCADDTNGFNPRISFEPPIAGQYDIWVGTFAAGAVSPAILRILTSLPF